VVLIGGGSNGDFGTTSAVQTAFAAMQVAYIAVQRAGKRLIVCTRPPRSNATAAQMAGVASYNSMVRRFAQQYGAVLFDMAAAVGHPNTGIGLAAGEYGVKANLIQPDAVHLSFTGAAIAGAALAQALQPFIPGGSPWGLAVGGTTTQDVIYDATTGVNEYGNLFANGKMLGTGGTKAAPYSTGSLADGWSVNAGGTVPATGGTGTLAKVANNGPTSRGEWQQIAIGAGTTGQVGNIEVFRSSVVSVFNGSQGLSIGDSIYGAMRFEVDSDFGGPDGLSHGTLSFAIQCLNSSFATLATTTALNRAATNNFFRTPSGVIVLPEIVIPATTAHVFAYIRGDGVGTFRVTDIQGRKVVR
jgi:hypothetical protein